MTDGAKTRTSKDPEELWNQWYQTASRVWSDALLRGEREASLDPSGIYRQWLKDMENVRERMEPGLEGILDPKLLWKQWLEAAPEGPFPPDPLTLLGQWYNATNEAWSGIVEDIISDEEFVGASSKLFQAYAGFHKAFHRASEDYFKNLPLSTRSDITRVAGLIVNLEDKVDRIEDALEEYQDGQDQVAISEAVSAVEERIGRVEDKLDRLLAAVENIAKQREEG